jgi:hypothetical protein
MKITPFDNLDYTIKFQLSAIIILLLSLIVFSIAPSFKISEPVFFSFGEESITFEIIDRTIQQDIPPPPSRPRLSLILTQDMSVEDPDILPFLDINTQLNGSFIDVPTTSFSDMAATERPQRPPRVTRIVEPVTPAGVIEDNLRAEITVTFLINPDGSIDELSVTDIKVLNRQSGMYIESTSIGNQVLEATLEAARQWQFRAATDNGKPVKAFSSHVFIIGR